MLDINNALQAYILETLGIEPDIAGWNAVSTLPRFLRETYAFNRTTILNREYLLARPVSGKDSTPGAVLKHFDQIKELARIDVIFVDESLPAWNRKRLVEKKISFIIPGNQMYLPLLGIDLREYIRLPSIREKPVRIGPSAQMLALFAFSDREKTEWTGADLAGRCGLSLMTVHRAFDDLGETGAFTVSMDGNRRMLGLVERNADTWNKLKSFTATPVAKSIVISAGVIPRFAVMAGLSALSLHSDIAAPDIPEFAAKMTTWKIHDQNAAASQSPLIEGHMARLQLWRYEPRFRESDMTADMLSVILSLEGHEDVRIVQALERALGDVLC